jgi:hypothetical protein
MKYEKEIKNTLASKNLEDSQNNESSLESHLT